MDQVSISSKTFHNSNIVEVKQLSEENKQSDSEKVKEPTKEEVEMKIKALNKILDPTFVSIQFELHEQSQTYFAKVVDTKTNEVIREIPSRKLLDMHVEIKKFLGMLFDQKI
ncbi:flagellar biosynthesis protein FlaG [Priestia megaterium]|nr:flagellar biosynthesis protein FlaG [Priestia megaterium]